MTEKIDYKAEVKAVFPDAKAVMAEYADIYDIVISDGTKYRNKIASSYWVSDAWQSAYEILKQQGKIKTT